MITCILLCKKRHSFFNLERIYDATKYRFVCIIPEANLHLIADEKCFDEIVSVSSIVENEIEPIIQNEINLSGSSDNVRLLCLDEMDILTAASIREKFNIPGGRVTDYLPFRDKILMKEILYRDNIRVPHYISLKDIESNEAEIIYEKIIAYIGSPFIVKPILGASSLHTAKIDNYNKFLDWHGSVDKAIDDFEAEEFIEGKLYHCDSFVKSGEIVFSEVSEYLTTCLDYANGLTSDGSILLPKHDRLRNSIIEFNRNVINALSPPDGALHHEIFVKENGEIVFLEIAARPGGGEIVKALEKNYSINLYEQTIKSEIGGDACFEVRNNLYHCWIYTLLPEGKIKNLHQPQLKSQFEIEWKVSVGDVIAQSKTSVLRQASALITLHHSDFQVIYSDFNYLRTFQAVEIE